MYETWQFSSAALNIISSNSLLIFLHQLTICTKQLFGNPSLWFIHVPKSLELTSLSRFAHQTISCINEKVFSLLILIWDFSLFFLLSKYRDNHKVYSNCNLILFIWPTHAIMTVTVLIVLYINVNLLIISSYKLARNIKWELLSPKIKIY